MGPAPRLAGMYFLATLSLLITLLRIISFITLGIVLLIIGYLYSRKADQTEAETEPE